MVRVLRRRPDASGAAAVEFALVSIPFMLLMMGMISFGVLFAQKLALGNGAREGARYAVVDGRTCADVVAATKDAANVMAMNGTSATVTVKRGTSAASATTICTSSPGSTKPCTGSSTGDSIFVRVDYTSQLIVPLWLVDSSFPISGEGVFRCEFS